MNLTKPQRKLLERVEAASSDGTYVKGHDLNVAFNLSALGLLCVLSVGQLRGGNFAITDAGRAALTAPQLHPGQHHTRHPWRDTRFGKEAKP